MSTEPEFVPDMFAQVEQPPFGWPDGFYLVDVIDKPGNYPVTFASLTMYADQVTTFSIYRARLFVQSGATLRNNYSTCIMLRDPYPVEYVGRVQVADGEGWDYMEMARRFATADFPPFSWDAVVNRRQYLW